MPELSPVWHRAVLTITVINASSLSLYALTCICVRTHMDITTFMYDILIKYFNDVSFCFCFIGLSTCSLLWSLIYVWDVGWICVRTCGGQRTALGSCFSPPCIFWGGTHLVVLAANIFIHWAILLAPFFLIHCRKRSTLSPKDKKRDKKVGFGACLLFLFNVYECFACVYVCTLKWLVLEARTECQIPWTSRYRWLWATVFCVLKGWAVFPALLVICLIKNN